MDKAEFISKCLSIAHNNYLYIPYEGKSPIVAYSLGGIETKASNVCHYCSLDVLKKIIGNSSLRFTDIRCLEDKLTI